jgi:hypothetical protein
VVRVVEFRERDAMRRTTRLMTVGAVAVVAATLTPAAGEAAAGSTLLPFSQKLRRCDFSDTDYNGPTGFARTTGVMHSDGSTVAADVQMATAIPGIRYDVRLIQMPRPSSASCNGGDPGVSTAPLFTDDAGGGAATVAGPIAPGATGAWVVISRPSEFSQDPAEFYTSEFVAPI